MKRFMLNTILSLAMLILTGSISALTPMTRSNIQTLIKDINNGTVSSDTIWDRIKALNIPASEDNTPLTKQLDQAAFTSLMSAGYKVSPGTRLTQDIRAGKPQPMIESVSTRTSKKPKPTIRTSSLEPLKPLTIKASAQVSNIMKQLAEEISQNQDQKKPILNFDPDMNSIAFNDLDIFLNELRKESKNISDKKDQDQLMLIATQMEEYKNNNIPITTDLSKPNAITMTPIESPINPIGPDLTQAIITDTSITPSKNLTLEEALKELDLIKNTAKQAKNKNDIENAYKSFYQIQDTYFGLSGVPTTQGRLWWKTTTPSEKNQYAQAAGDTLKIILNKELELKDLTPDQIKELQKKADSAKIEINKYNPIEALKNKTITEEQFNTILSIRGDLLKWDILREKNKILTSDKNKVLKTVTEARSLGNFLGDFSKELANTLENYVTQNPKFKQVVAVVQAEKEKEENLIKKIKEVDEKITTAQSDFIKNTSIVDFQWFANNYQEILDLYNSIQQKTTQLSKEINIPLYKMSEYRYIVSSKRIDLTKEVKDNQDPKKDVPLVDLLKPINKISEIDDHLKQVDAAYNPFLDRIVQNKSDLINAENIQQFKKIIDQKDQVVFPILIELGNNFVNTIKDLLFGIEKNKYPDNTGYTLFKEKIDYGITKLTSDTEKRTINDLIKKIDDALSVVIQSAIQQYSKEHQLPTLHLVATGKKTDIANAIEKMKNANKNNDKSLNFIVNTITELQPVWAVNLKLKIELQKLVFINFAYILAAFDAFRHALYTEGIKNDAPATWFDWFASFWKSEQQNQTFSKLTSIVDESLQAIVNTIAIHEKIFLSSLQDFIKDYTSYKEYVSGFSIGGQLQIDKFFQNQGINDFIKDNKYIYAYEQRDNKIKFPGSIEVTGAIGAGNESSKLTNKHKKSLTYQKLLDLDKAIIATAYNNTEWQDRMKAQFEFDALKDIVQNHVQLVDEIKKQIADIKNQIQNAQNLENIATLENQIKEVEKAYEIKRQEQQKIYEEAYAKYLRQTPQNPIELEQPKKQ